MLEDPVSWAHNIASRRSFIKEDMIYFSECKNSGYTPPTRHTSVGLLIKKCLFCDFKDFVTLNSIKKYHLFRGDTSRVEGVLPKTSTHVVSFDDVFYQVEASEDIGEVRDLECKSWSNC